MRAHPPHRLAEIVATLLAERGLKPTPVGRALPTGSDDASQLVFVGNWQDPCPRRLLFDPQLEPIDIVAWQVIRVHASAHQMVAFPSYVELMRALRVSRATVARAIAVLRLVGWLPLCASLRDGAGRFAGQVYALNDEPLPLPEILAIDDGYVDFVAPLRAHRSAHVRTVAAEVWGAVERAALAPSAAAVRPVRLGEHLAVRLSAMLTLADGRVQKVNAGDRVQNLNAVRSSSGIELEETTTTRPSSEIVPKGAGADDLSPLTFPEALSLTASQQRVLELRLQRVGPELRQGVLDEAAGRVVAKRKTSDPVRCEFDYVARLCVRAERGEFVLTDAGERIRRDREERAAAEGRLQRAVAHSEAQRLKEVERHLQRARERE